MVRAVVVAAASLYSRIATLALLAIGARALSFEEFGVLAVAIGVAIAVANTFSMGAGDQLAAQSVANPRAAWRFVHLSSALLLMVSAFSTFATLVSPAPQVVVIAVFAGSVSISTSTAACMTAMNYLRGCGWVASGSILAYVLMPTLRTAAVAGAILMALETSLLAVITAINLASVVAALVAYAFAYFVSRQMAGNTTVVRTATRRQAVVLGTAVALAWGVLGQGDVTALAIFRDAAAAGEFTPTMRLMEALTALALGVKFAQTRHLVTNSDRGLQVKILAPLGIAYSLCTILVFLSAPAVLAATFGESYKFDYKVAVILAPAYLLSSAVSILLQILIARGSAHQVTSWTAVIIGLAVAFLAIGAISAGSVGVAVADLLVFASWFVALLRLEITSRPNDGLNGKGLL